MIEQDREPQGVRGTDDVVEVVDHRLVLQSNSNVPLMRKRPGPITLADRQGVFAHSFKCWICDLEFVLFSWQRNRHGVGRIHCPECGQPTPMLHWLTVLSASADFDHEGQSPEIYQMVPVGDGDLMDDSSEPPDDRYVDPGEGGTVTTDGRRDASSRCITGR
jgi:hypothetical protein